MTSFRLTLINEGFINETPQVTDLLVKLKEGFVLVPNEEELYNLLDLDGRVTNMVDTSVVDKIRGYNNMKWASGYPWGVYGNVLQWDDKYQDGALDVPMEPIDAMGVEDDAIDVEVKPVEIGDFEADFSFPMEAKDEDDIEDDEVLDEIDTFGLPVSEEQTLQDLKALAGLKRR